MLADLDAEAPSSAPDRSSAPLGILRPSDSATNADGPATAVRPKRSPNRRLRQLLLSQGKRARRPRSGEQRALNRMRPRRDVQLSVVSALREGPPSTEVAGVVCA